MVPNLSAAHTGRIYSIYEYIYFGLIVVHTTHILEKIYCIFDKAMEIIHHFHVHVHVHVT